MQKQIKKVLLLGSGGLRIGQAGEFDYSGSQAIKALKEEGIFIVLVNPNIATVQTDPGMADVVYLQPLNLETVTKIIAKERPDGILLGFGGQTALNLGLKLEEKGVLKKYGVQVLGTPVSAIRLTEDRDLFKKELAKIDVKTPASFAVTTVEEALKSAKKIGYPVMMRSGFSLGGLGSGKVGSEKELREKAAEALHGAPQILIEEYLGGWKEIEYEIVRDSNDTTITVCNMENFDPMGIHTGESIVVAPSQTLTNYEYHMLREVAIRVARSVGIVGECNIQYALNPKTSEYRVIEMNARLSRSSALASKATGYPLAFVAAKLALGKNLHELRNSVTKKTSACFEPALDYLVVKIPRWDLTKFKAAERTIGTEMKSVGEVMAIGRSFPEALQKAVRMLNIGASGLSDYPAEIENPEMEIKHPTDRRLFAIYKMLQKGTSVAKIHEWSKIDKWFLEHLKAIAGVEKKISETDLPLQRGRTVSSPARGEVDRSRGPEGREIELLRTAKQFGFSDKMIAKLTNSTEDTIRELRIKNKITPVIKQIDTLAGEFSAETNYLYTTYHGTEHDVLPSGQPTPTPLKRGLPRPIIVLGSGPYCIGSSVEFDWCSVNTARTLRKLKESPIIINSNPETVSTDYDESDRLYFEELTLERVRDIVDFEKAKGVIVSVGGQIANNLALPLAKVYNCHSERGLAADEVSRSLLGESLSQPINRRSGQRSLLRRRDDNKGPRILGTSADSIDAAENRQRFSELLNKLGIDQPAWTEVKNINQALDFAERVGYPVLVRPSYVLSGTAMNVVRSQNELRQFLSDASLISPEHPVVISQFIMNAKELDIDGVARAGKIEIYAIAEHVENAGVHSGDATIVLPPQRLYLQTIRRAKQIAKQIVAALKITGPFNIQFIAKDNAIKVIECNLRASRSFPFVSKVTNNNFIEIATKVILDKFESKHFNTLDLPYVGVKSPQFSYQRLKGADPIAGVEMASTGEVACLGHDYFEAFFASWLATEQQVQGKNILLSIGGEQKIKFLDHAKQLVTAGFNLYATRGTHEFLKDNGVPSNFVYKASDSAEPNVMTFITSGKLSLIINIPRGNGRDNTTDGYKIRRAATNHHIPVITNAQNAGLLLKCLFSLPEKKYPILSWQEFIQEN